MMSETRMPMRWPSSWTSPAHLDLIKNTPVNFLFIPAGETARAVADAARAAGIAVAESGTAPPGVALLEGVWPGVKMTESGMVDRAAAGPTGNPWVDSNGWSIRLARARQPEAEIWVDAEPKITGRSADAYGVAVADAAAHGGKWIVSLAPDLSAGLAAGNGAATAAWKKLAAALAFFAERRDWASYAPRAIIGVMSDFAGDNEFTSHECLNLLARTNAQYSVLFKEKVTAGALAGLRAVVYPDAAPLEAATRNMIVAFVEAGGMLIAGPKWGPAAGVPDRREPHTRYDMRVLGKGRLAIAKGDIEDAYRVSNDAVVLVGHRYDLLRLWNGGAAGSYLTQSPDRRRTIAQFLFYSGYRSFNPSVRVAGRYRAATLWTLEDPRPVKPGAIFASDSAEIHLPAVSRYAAVELEA